jgi:hypothetical protein
MDRREFVVKTLAVGIGVSSFLKIGARIPSIRSSRHGLWTVPVLRVDYPNSNGRIYPRAVVEKIAELPSWKNCQFGQIGMPKDGVAHLDKISHKDRVAHFDKISHMVLDLKLRGNYLLANISPTTNLQGRILQQMLDQDTVVFRSSGFGSVQALENGHFVVGPNFELTGIHALPIDQAAKL